MDVGANALPGTQLTTTGSPPAQVPLVFIVATWPSLQLDRWASLPVQLTAYSQYVYFFRRANILDRWRRKGDFCETTNWKTDKITQRCYKWNESTQSYRILKFYGLELLPTAAGGKRLGKNASNEVKVCRLLSTNWLMGNSMLSAKQTFVALKLLYYYRQFRKVPWI